MGSNFLNSDQKLDKHIIHMSIVNVHKEVFTS